MDPVEPYAYDAMPFRYWPSWLIALVIVICVITLMSVLTVILRAICKKGIDQVQDAALEEDTESDASEILKVDSSSVDTSSSSDV